ncbi:MAG: hypothetical protein ABIH85_06960 [Candidatus Omnitrophota bacterium]|nr:hypothetical protein [Candidatus Omnitrophota bacterium]
MEKRDLCITCANNQNCSFPRKELVSHCEEFELNKAEETKRLYSDTNFKD